jgi:hypothetical protein
MKFLAFYESKILLPVFTDVERHLEMVESNPHPPFFEDTFSLSFT